MNKWIAEFDLEDGDTMPEHMELEYKGARLDFHCRPKEPVLDKIRAEIKTLPNANPSFWYGGYMLDLDDVFEILDKYKGESEDK